MAEFSVTDLCAALNVSREGYYKWKKCKITKHNLRDNELLVHIKAVFAEYKNRYGAPRIHDELKDRNIKCGRKRVALLMHDNRIKATTNSKHSYPVHPNLFFFLHSRIFASSFIVQ